MPTFCHFDRREKSYYSERLKKPGIMTIAIPLYVRQGPFFRGERIQYPVFCITRSKGGRKASVRLSTKEERLSARILAARLAKPFSQFLVDYFFRSEKRPLPDIHSLLSYLWLFIYVIHYNSKQLRLLVSDSPRNDKFWSQFILTCKCNFFKGTIIMGITI
jgi:hypothetical protein